MKIIFVAVFVMSSTTSCVHTLLSGFSQNILLIKTLYGNVRDVRSIGVTNEGRLLDVVVVYSVTVAIVGFTINVQQ